MTRLDPADLRITHATAEDFPAIRTLADLVWHQHYPGIISAAQIDYMLERGYSLSALTAFIAEQGAGLLLARRGPALIAFAGYYSTDDMTEMKLDKLYVLPEHRGAGAGHALIERVARIAGDAGFRTLVLNVNKNNVKAIRAYERNGFTIREAVVDDIGHGYVMDDYVMTMPLPAFPGEPPDALART